MTYEDLPIKNANFHCHATDYQKVLEGKNQQNHHPSDRRNLSPAKPSAAVAYGLTIVNPPLISMEHFFYPKIGWLVVYLLL